MDFTTNHHLQLACKKLEEQGEKLEQQQKKLVQQKDKLVQQGKKITEQEKNLETSQREYNNRMEAAEKNIEKLLNRFNFERANENGQCFEWKIVNLKSRLYKYMPARLSYEPFFLCGYKMILFLELKPSKIQARKSFWTPDEQSDVHIGGIITGGEFDGNLKWPFTKTLHFDLVSESVRLCSVDLQPHEPIPRPKPKEEKAIGDTILTKFGKITDKDFPVYFIYAKFTAD